MIKLTIISWTPKDYLTDGVASGLIGGVLVVAMTALLSRWIVRRNRTRKVR